MGARSRADVGMSDASRLSREVLEFRARVLGQRASTEVETFESFGLHAHLRFRAGDLDFVVKLDHVREVLARPEVTAVPCVPAAIAGVLNLRGMIVDVVELALLFGPEGPVEAPGAARKVILCESAEGAFGLRVDEVAGIVSVTPESIEEVPATYPDSVRRLLDGVVRCDPDQRQISSVLSVAKVFACREFDRVKRSKALEEA